MTGTPRSVDARHFSRLSCTVDSRDGARRLPDLLPAEIAV